MSELRASDADRERTAERLRTAAGEGRLSADELEERLERALSARTESELEPLTADLPAPRAPAPRRPRRRWDTEHLRAYVGVSVMLVAIWALTGAGYFWPIWPILGWGVGLLTDAGRLGRPCRRRSSNPGSSTGRWPSSAAAARGSGERLR
jgi:Domain of unknown function (DUF1707)/2TM domain